MSVVTLEAPVPSIEKAPDESMSYVPVTSMSRLAPALRSTRPAEVRSNSLAPSDAIVIPAPPNVSAASESIVVAPAASIPYVPVTVSR